MLLVVLVQMLEEAQRDHINQWGIAVAARPSDMLVAEICSGCRVIQHILYLTLHPTDTKMVGCASKCCLQAITCMCLYRVAEGVPTTMHVHDTQGCLC